MTHDEIIDTLNDLIRVCNDGVEGFRTCAEHANISSATLKSMLTQRQHECASASDALRSLVLEQGADAVTGTTVGGALRRGWLVVKTSVTGKTDRAVLEECERGEDVAKEAYRKALAQGLPSPIRAVVEIQYQGVLRNHDLIKKLRDEAELAHH